jgi:ABC-type phosphate transport system substrate-binding protein
MAKSRNSLFILMVVVVGALALAACGAQSAPPRAASEVNLAQQTQQLPLEGGGSYTDVSAVGLAAMLENKDFPLINVHIPYEGEIERTDLFIPFDATRAPGSSSTAAVEV